MSHISELYKKAKTGESVNDEKNDKVEFVVVHKKDVQIIYW